MRTKRRMKRRRRRMRTRMLTRNPYRAIEKHTDLMPLGTLNSGPTAACVGWTRVRTRLITHRQAPRRLQKRKQFRAEACQQLPGLYDVRPIFPGGLIQGPCGRPCIRHELLHAIHTRSNDRATNAFSHAEGFRLDFLAACILCGVRHAVASCDPAMPSLCFRRILEVMEVARSHG